MDKKMLQSTFRNYKKVAGVQFAITNPDGLGDCGSCVSAALGDKYGDDATGIWANHWTRGMNGGDPIDELDHIYINHDIAGSQIDDFYKVFGENYNVTPLEYDRTYCFCLYEKGIPVWEVTYVNEYERTCRESFTDEIQALKYLNHMFSMDWAKSPALTRLF